MKKLSEIINEIDKISGTMEDFDSPLSYSLSYKLDRVAQSLTEYTQTSYDKISSTNVVIKQYLEKVAFIADNETKLKELINKNNSRNASIIYKCIKNHFGSLNRKDAINFIKDILKNT